MPLHPPYERMGLRCPQCNRAMHVTYGGGVRIWCRYAIGEEAFDRETGRRFFPAYSIHSRLEWQADEPLIARQIANWYHKQERREAA